MSTLSERIAARAAHPPINGCTVRGPHDCILRRSPAEPVPTVLDLHRRRAFPPRIAYR